MDDRTMVPLRFIAEALGGTVEWDRTTRTANILRRPSSITGMDCGPGVGRSRVTLSLSEPLSAINPSVDGNVLSLDLYPAISAVDQPTRVAYDPLIQLIRLEANGRSVRFEARLWSAPSYRYSLSSDGTQLTIEFDHTVTGIESRQEGHVSTVHIASSGKVEYKAFPLQNPPRLVIDLTGVQLGPTAPTSLEVNQPYVTRVRAAQYSRDPETVRVVLDLVEQVPYEIDSTGFGLQVRFAVGAVGTRLLVQSRRGEGDR